MMIKKCVLEIYRNRHWRLTLCTKDDPNVYNPRRDSVYVPQPISDDDDDDE